MEESDEDSDHGSHSLWSHANFSQEFLDFLADDSITYYPGHTAKTDPYFRDSTAPMSAFRNDIANCTLAPIDYRTEPPLNYEYDSGFRQCANNENVVCLKLTVPVKGKGSRVNSLVVDVYVYRATKTMIIRALHSMTNQWKLFKVGRRFTDALRIEQESITSNLATNGLLRDSISNQAINDSFKAYTGLHHMAEGLKELCIPGEDIDKAIRSAQELIRPKIVHFLNQKGEEIILPNMEHYNERGVPLSTVDVLALAHHLDKKPEEFKHGRPLAPFQFRDKPSEFIIPRYLFLNSSIEEKYYRFRFATDSSKLEKTAVVHGIYKRF